MKVLVIIWLWTMFSLVTTVAGIFAVLIALFLSDDPAAFGVLQFFRTPFGILIILTTLIRWLRDRKDYFKQ